uniref:SCP domain-containing protein n=1 Tax=Chromera velia CCMP2878 TaxID=1169474 RepID=A0A0G4F8T1_9ALVE|eukprot:Cvel_15824.t1-p1 / transcript=Cvel_15824.t1 / gene=Cvel_15824 / organism=Chromera_velia_CCMP2878 / gene_product=hypothetical protein / transcript_product=hypothetical protein / location=Cvel_scaffold1189:15910-19054(-) / protein_length=749 / sequence_SO=supercontig / SO=protein_coding / is_pseudo=false
MALPRKSFFGGHAPFQEVILKVLGREEIVQAEFLAHVNRERKQKGVPPASWDFECAEAAEVLAQTTAHRHFLRPDDPVRSVSGSQLAHFIPEEETVGPVSGGVRTGAVSLHASIRKALEAWKGGTAQVATLADPSMTRIGAAIAVTRRGLFVSLVASSLEDEEEDEATPTVNPSTTKPSRPVSVSQALQSPHNETAFTIPGSRSTLGMSSSNLRPGLLGLKVKSKGRDKEAKTQRHMRWNDLTHAINLQETNRVSPLPPLSGRDGLHSRGATRNSGGRHGWQRGRPTTGGRLSVSSSPSPERDRGRETSRGKRGHVPRSASSSPENNAQRSQTAGGTLRGGRSRSPPNRLTRAEGGGNSVEERESTRRGDGGLQEIAVSPVAKKKQNNPPLFPVHVPSPETNNFNQSQPMPSAGNPFRVPKPPTLEALEVEVEDILKEAGDNLEEVIDPFALDDALEDDEEYAGPPNLSPVTGQQLTLLGTALITQIRMTSSAGTDGQLQHGHTGMQGKAETLLTDMQERQRNVLWDCASDALFDKVRPPFVARKTWEHPTSSKHRGQTKKKAMELLEQLREEVLPEDSEKKKEQSKRGQSELAQLLSKLASSSTYSRSPRSGSSGRSPRSNGGSPARHALAASMMEQGGSLTRSPSRAQRGKFGFSSSPTSSLPLCNAKKVNSPSIPLTASQTPQNPFRSGEEYEDRKPVPFLGENLPPNEFRDGAATVPPDADILPSPISVSMPSPPTAALLSAPRV